MQLTARQSARMVLMLILASIGAAVATFFALSSGIAPFEQHPERIWFLLLLDVGLLVAMGTLIASQINAYRRQAGEGVQKSKLRRRIVLSFCILAALPTIAVTIFSTLFFNLGIQAWFNERVNTAVQESLAVAEAYLAEHRENIRADALALADDINRLADLATINPPEFNRFVTSQASRRRLTEVLVLQKNRIIAQGRFSLTLTFESLPQDAIARAGDGEVVILPSDSGNNDKVRALTRLENLADGYLLVGRLVDDKVVSHLEVTRGAVNEYQGLKSQLTRLQWSFSAVFVMLTLVLILAAVWYGLMFAARLTVPISRLSTAAERVRAGDYSGQVEVDNSRDEINVLARTFNRMTEQLGTQRSELIEANRQLDERRRFSEAVLAGVSAGVLALDREKRVTLLNRSAAAMLQTEGATPVTGLHVNEVLPGIQELLAQAETNTMERVVQGSITLGSNSDARTLHVRAVPEYGAVGLLGFIVTFDDITPLVAAQRTAAWSDVARRVAHEIKNPLTPIALSAERLKRKFSGSMEGADAEAFERYVDTISRHVSDIGRMVEEFVSFARMPGAVMKQANLLDIIHRELFSAQVRHPDISFKLNCAEKAVDLMCDERQLSQIFANLLKNAAESIEGEDVQKKPARKGEISVNVTREGEHILANVLDNGPGFPPDKTQSLLDPYVTTRAKGTGLGLAIVKKIMEEHGGMIKLNNRDEGGASVMLSFLSQCDINAPSEG